MHVYALPDKNASGIKMTHRFSSILNQHSPMKTFLFSALALCFTLSLNAQSDSPVVMEKKPLGGYVFSQHGERLRVKEVVDIMESNTAVYDQMKRAQTNYGWATVVGGAGGFLIGWPLGTALGGGDPEWGMLAAGAVLVGVSIPITSKFVRQSQTAIALYNEGIGATEPTRPSMQLLVQGNGLGLRWQF